MPLQLICASYLPIRLLVGKITMDGSQPDPKLVVFPMCAQDRAVVEAAISQWGGVQAQVTAMQRELDDVAKLATSKDSELRYKMCL